MSHRLRSRSRKANTIKARPTTTAKPPINGARNGTSEPGQGHKEYAEEHRQGAASGQQPPIFHLGAQQYRGEYLERTSRDRPPHDDVDQPVWGQSLARGWPPSPAMTPTAPSANGSDLRAPRSGDLSAGTKVIAPSTTA